MGLETEALIVLKWNKKTPQSIKFKIWKIEEFQCLFGFIIVKTTLKVEPEGIEPSSKQRISKLSTCLFPD